MAVFYQLRNTVNICDFGEGQITFHDQFRKLQTPNAITLLATVLITSPTRRM